MFKVKFSLESVEKIDFFIEKYLKIFEKRFSDTWIFNEKIILEVYRQKSIEFKNEIYNSIEDVFWNSEILWYKSLENNKRRSWITIGNYNLFIEYFEDLENKIRVIEKVEFHKK